MKKLLNFLFIVLTVVSLSGCGNFGAVDEEKVVPPKNLDIPVKGSWLVEKCLNRKFEVVKEEEKWRDTNFEFDKDGVKLQNHLWKKPGYKIKKVNSEDYFFYNYRILPRKIGVENREVTVITITAGNKYLYDFVKLSESQLVAVTEENVLFLRKVSDEVSYELKMVIVNEEENKNYTGSKDMGSYRSGLVLGIKTTRKPSSKESAEYQYKTIFIAADNKNLHPFLQVKDLLMPRMNGFWKLEVRRMEKENKLEDVLFTYKLPAGGLKKQEDPFGNEFWKNRNGSISKSLLYAGNDYICMEIKGEGTYSDGVGKWEECKLRMLPVDSLSNSRGVKISDIMGLDGVAAMDTARNKSMNEMSIRPEEEIGRNEREENFSLIRRAGHWFIKGRINYVRNNSLQYGDYGINLIPPSTLVFYDKLVLPRTTIKDTVPEVLDTYTSPNGDIAVVLTNKKLLVYAISDKKLVGEPLGVINLNSSDSVIMAEWGLGYYVEKWEEIFMKNGAERITN
ncbi:MAG: hypothetical protein N2645_00860 [Clostridia bacterium]|nr:hypothetical protein [Clostridia bacterium]